MKPKLIIHVGPHKTGTSNIQHALHCSRSLLLEDGVLYPPSIGNAQFPEQHADLAVLIRDGDSETAKSYLDDIHAVAVKESVDAVLLSSEMFSDLFYCEHLASVIDHAANYWDVGFVYFRRRLSDYIYSNIMQHLTGDLGQFARYNYDLDRWIAAFISWNEKKENFFRAQNTVFLSLEEFEPSSLAQEFLWRVLGKRYRVAPTLSLNTSSEKFKSPVLLISYPLRMLISINNNISMLAVECVKEANELLADCKIPAERIDKIVSEFEAIVRSRIEFAIADR